MEPGRLKVHLVKQRISILLTLLVLGSVSCSTTVDYPPHQNIAQSGSWAVNINTATVEELEKLPNIGRKMAEAIIEFRTVNGPFRRPEHLMQIRGVSEARFAELRPYIKTD